MAPAGVVFGGARPTGDVSVFYAPTFGSEYRGLAGGGLAVALGTEYDFNDSKFDEFAIARIEGVFVHGGGENTIGGATHRETLDAGFVFLDAGLGIRRGDWSLALVLGVGRGGGDLQGELARSDTALTSAIQFAPRVSRRINRDWSCFAEYRAIFTADAYGRFFDDHARALRLHAMGVGISRRF